MSARRARVGALAEQVRGVSYGKEDASDSPLPGYLPVLRAGNITQDGLVYDNLVFVPKERISEKQKIRLHDIVVAASSGSLDVVGKAAPALSDFEGSFGAFCKVLRPNKNVHAGYFAHFFKTSDYRRRMSGLAAGANINNLRNEHLDDTEIPVPPLGQQRRIAAILDRAEALRAQRRQSLAECSALVRAIFLDMIGDPVSNPKSFLKVPLGSLIRLKSGNSVLVSELSDSNDFPVYGGNGINGHHTAFMFEAPTVVIGRVGVYCGVVHVTKPKAWVTDNALFVSHIPPQLRLQYLAEALSVANLNQYAGRAAQPLVSGGRIYPVEILVPPLQLQDEFGKRATTVQTLLGSYKASFQELDALFASLQHQAFRGEL